MKAKFLFTLFTIAIIVSCANAQKVKEADVPATVVKSFAQMNPSVKVSHWEMEAGMYEAEYMDGKTETSVLFTAEGKMVMKEIEIQTS